MAVGLLLTAGLLACGSGGDARASRDYRGSVFPEPLPKPDFTLADAHGRDFDFRAQTDGYATLLYFGYTHCPDVCPIHLANIAAVLVDLPYELRQRIKVVFVTTDPERDTPQRLREWLGGFDPSFIGLRGDLDQVNRIMAELYLPAAIKQAGSDGDYTVGHAASVIAFTPDGAARVAYAFGTRQADWAHDLPKLVNDRSHD